MRKRLGDVLVKRRKKIGGINMVITGKTAEIIPILEFVEGLTGYDLKDEKAAAANVNDFSLKTSYNVKDKNGVVSIISLEVQITK